MAIFAAQIVVGYWKCLMKPPSQMMSIGGLDFRSDVNSIIVTVFLRCRFVENYLLWENILSSRFIVKKCKHDVQKLIKLYIFSALDVPTGFERDFFLVNTVFSSAVFVCSMRTVY